MLAHPLAVHQVHDEGGAGCEGALHRFEDGKVVLLAVEIAERVAEDADAMEFAVAEAEAAGVALVERHLQVALLGALAGEADQVARAVEADDAVKPPLRQFERMAALAAAQIEDAVVALKAGAADQQIDLVAGVAVVLDDVAVGFEVERVEQRAPPFRRQVAFEVRNRPQGAGTQAALSPGRLRSRRRLGSRSRASGVALRGGRRPARSLAHCHDPWNSDMKNRRHPAMGAPGSECDISRSAFEPFAPTPSGTGGAGEPKQRAGREASHCSQDVEGAHLSVTASGATGCHRRERRKSAKSSGRLSVLSRLPAAATGNIAARLRSVRRLACGTGARTADRWPNQGAGRSSIAWSWRPVERSRMRSRRPPSDSASATTIRSPPTDICSIWASWGIWIGPTAVCSAAGPAVRWAARLTIKTPSVAMPPTIMMPMTMTRAWRARMLRQDGGGDG